MPDSAAAPGRSGASGGSGGSGQPRGLSRPGILRALTCPVCGDELRPGTGAVRCPVGHSFDLARQGYVNLLPGGSTPLRADDAAMVRARDRFLAAGHYDALTADLATAATGAVPEPRLVVDAGGGTGYYLASLLDRVPECDGLVLDLSRPAVRSAARAHPRAGAAVCDVWRPWPLRAGAVDLLLNVFAPRNGSEFARVLRRAGALVSVTPTAEHLRELVEPLGMLTVDSTKEARTERALAPYLRLEHRVRHTRRVALGPADVENLVAMGPSSWHVDAPTVRQRVEALGPVISVTVACHVSVYRPR